MRRLKSFRPLCSLTGLQNPRRNLYAPMIPIGFYYSTTKSRKNQVLFQKIGIGKILHGRLLPISVIYWRKKGGKLLKHKILFVLALACIPFLCAGSGGSSGIPDLLQDPQTHSAFAQDCADIILKNDFNIGPKILTYSHSSDIFISPNASISTTVYVDDAENEYEFYPNGELFLFSSENGASIDEFQPGTRNNSAKL